MTELTQDELTCLMIAEQHQMLAPIGRWEKSIKDLTARGLLRRVDDVSYVITDAGRLAAREGEDANDLALLETLGRVQKATPVQEAISDFAEQAAHHLVDAAQASAAVTGDTAEVAAQKLSQVILGRALQLLRR